MGTMSVERLLRLVCVLLIVMALLGATHQSVALPEVEALHLRDADGNTGLSLYGDGRVRFSSRRSGAKWEVSVTEQGELIFTGEGRSVPALRLTYVDGWPTLDLLGDGSEGGEPGLRPSARLRATDGGARLSLLGSTSKGVQIGDLEDGGWGLKAIQGDAAVRVGLRQGFAGLDVGGSLLEASTKRILRSGLFGDRDSNPQLLDAGITAAGSEQRFGHLLGVNGYMFEHYYRDVGKDQEGALLRLDSLLEGGLKVSRKEDSVVLQVSESGLGTHKGR